MSRPIIKIRDKYLIWSSVVDAPITSGMTLAELREFVIEEYGERELQDLPFRLKRVEEHGTSSLVESLDDLIAGNRAGEGENELTKDEIYEKYCTEEKDEIPITRDQTVKNDRGVTWTEWSRVAGFGGVAQSERTDLRNAWLRCEDPIVHNNVKEKMDDLSKWIVEVHKKHAQGCKGSCGEQEVGFHYSVYYDSYWFCRFGGYCLGDLSRWEEVQAPDLDQLIARVRLVIEEAIARNEKEG